MKYFLTSVLLFLSVFAFAQQQPKNEEEEMKEFQESIQKEVSRLENLLEMEDWQVFYTDSILVHDYTQMRAEQKELEAAKISDYNLYLEIQDKWMEQIYNGLNGILEEKQWQKYLKSGALKAKKERDKRAAKRK